MKILMLTRITYHEVYGLSLNITDIDPSYTLGEMALKRRQIIDQLVKEGIIDLNKKIPIPTVIQKIAVISSRSAAGYGDFMSRLDSNPYGFRFSHKIFQAYLQGEQAEKSIRSALRQCKRHKDTFDAVVIIRGGGSTVDLHCFDSYLLAKDIALFPLPVLTGIGHERDETVTDRVAHKMLMTPTAVAEYLISQAKSFEERIDELSHRLILRTNTVLDRGKDSLKNLAERLEWQTIQYLTTTSASLRRIIYLLQTQTLSFLRTPSIDLKTYEERLKGALHVLIKNNYHKLREFIRIATLYPKHMLSMRYKTVEHLEVKVNLLDPVTILRRGYSITYLHGKAIRDIASIKRDDIIDTRLYDGSITSIVERTKEKTDDEEQ
jgi:exodeoxyribonuclease VII large subunit